jgi:transglutaminase-like putative cysteine protease
MRLHIHHATRYRYTEPVAYSIQQLRVTPRSDACQNIVAWHVDLPGHPRAQRDAHGNTTHTLTLTEPHDEIDVIVDGEVDTFDSPVLLLREGGLSPLAYLADSPLATPDAALTAFARAAAGGGSPRQQAMALMQAVREHVSYVPGSTDVGHRADEVFALGSGVCQDMTHVFLAVCRAVGLPARYVSGYLLTESEHAASHAWADVWLADEGGWLSCDITHGELAFGHFCRLAVGRDYLDACPIRGVRRGGTGESMAVSVYVGDSRAEIDAELAAAQQQQQ